MKIFNLNIENYILLSIIFVGAVLRLYVFPDFPNFTDEVREAIVAYDLYSFKNFPLHSYSLYIGPIHAYFMAIVMWIFGPHIWVPRIINVIFNIALIYVSYLFAKEWTNKRIGLITALFTAFSPILILINSRVAWATCLSPFFGMLLLYVLKKFESQRTAKLAIFIGLLSGLLLNLHPLMLFFIIPVNIYAIFMVSKESIIKERFKYWGLIFVSALVIMFPLILSNILDFNSSFEGAVAQNNISQEKLTFNINDYLRDLDRLIAQEKHVINRAVIFDGTVIPEYEYKPLYKINSLYELSIYIFIFGIFLVLFSRKFNLLPIIAAILSIVLLSPMINTNYFEGLTVRYFSILIPLFDLICAYGIYTLFEYKNNKLLKALVVILGFITIIYTPLRNMNLFYSERDDLDMSLTKEIDFLAKKSKEGYKIFYVDEAFRGYADEYSQVEYMLKFGGLYEKYDVNVIDKDYQVEEKHLLVLPDGTKDEDEVSESDIEKEPLLKIIEDGDLDLLYEGHVVSVFN